MHFSTIGKILGIAVLTASVSSVWASPAFPFPQSKKYPYGNMANFAVTDSIQSHFNVWKGAWYTESGSTARVISPNDSAEISVSEGIAYGMLIMVYMSGTASDHQSEFDKLLAYWNKYAMSGSGSGMNWHVNNNTGAVGSGSATDADLDAAVALVMAYKQWGNSSYLTQAKSLITWIKSNDMESDMRVKPGSNWDQGLNASYVAPATFHLFYAVTGDASWNTAITVNMAHLSKCQNSNSGLVPDWCDWNSHSAITTSASVSGGTLGFFEDATRTPWRMAWGYYWYGDATAKAANDKIVNWLDTSTYSHASYIFAGYNLNGTIASDDKRYVSSAFVGGLGLAMASATTPKYYMETICETLLNTPGKTSITATIGEKYYSATLNILYLLLMTGNMPNLYDMTGYTALTTQAMRQPSAPTGTQISAEGLATVAGFTKWGAFSDIYGVTKMYPDSGSVPIYLDGDGTYAVKAELRIAPEPIYGTPDAVANRYPFAGVALSFNNKDSSYNFTNLKTIRLTVKTQGVIRIALLDSAIYGYDEEGSEAGYWIHPSEDYQTLDIDAGDDGTDAFVDLVRPSWAKAIIGRAEMLAKIRGVKFEPKMTKGGYGSFSVKDVQFLDASGNSVLPAGVQLIKSGMPLTGRALRSAGNELQYSGFSGNANLRIYSMNGTLLQQKAISGSGALSIASLPRGVLIARVADGSAVKTLKFAH